MHSRYKDTPEIIFFSKAEDMEKQGHTRDLQEFRESVWCVYFQKGQRHIIAELASAWVGVFLRSLQKD